jgi:hypothetical protein
MKTVKVQYLSRLEGNRWSMKLFRAVKVYDILMVDMCHYIFVKTSNVNPNVNDGA